MQKFKSVIVFVLLVALCFSFAACDPQVGPAGADGKDGSSAYQIWLEQGNTGSQQDFLNWLKGASGTNGADGTSGADGLSAYDIWLEAGNQGTVEEFLEWLKGDQGDRGSRGPAGAKGDKGDAGDDSPYGAMAVEVSTAREFLDALNPRLKKEIIVLKNDIDFSNLMDDQHADYDSNFTGTVAFEGINRTIIGRDIDVYEKGTGNFIETRPAVLNASFSISNGGTAIDPSGVGPANVKFYNVYIRPIITADADFAKTDNGKDIYRQAGVVVAQGSTLEMYQSKIIMDMVEYGDDVYKDGSGLRDTYGLYIAATADSVYLEDVTVDNISQKTGGKYALWSSIRELEIYRGNFFGIRYGLAFGAYLADKTNSSSTQTPMQLGDVKKMFIVELAENTVRFTDDTDWLTNFGNYYGKVAIMTLGAPDCYYTMADFKAGTASFPLPPPA